VLSDPRLNKEQRTLFGSELKSIVIELYRNDYRRRNCDTADASTCVIVNCVAVRANVE
jgi:hypothetical protein